MKSSFSSRFVRQILVLVILVVCVISPQTQALAATPPVQPTIQATVGDSITRGFNVSRSCLLIDCPVYSWSTGTDKTVKSHRSRFTKAPVVYNYAKTGVKVNDLDRQLGLVSSVKAQYVTVLIGANDACTSSSSNMTSIESFKSSFDSALANYFSSPNSGLMFVSSIPNVYNLYQVLKGSSTARTTWSLYGICQSALGSRLTDDQRKLVEAQIVAFNSIMQTTCESYVGKCKWDGGAVFNTAFVASDISTVDYFHPSVAGQAKLAQVTWQASYWPGP